MKTNVSGLPHAWCDAKISEITAVNPTLDKTGIPDDIEVSFVPMPAVQAESGVINVSKIRKFSEVKKGYTPFHEGDVLFAKITQCMENGKMAVVPEVINGLGFGSTEFHVLRALSGVSAKYIYYYVSSQAFRREAEHNMSGAVGQRRVTTPYLSACDVALPPTNEQHRIVAKIEELFSKLDKGIENLKTAQAQLKVYRQALLKHAFEGKLTAQWREQNKDKLETAAALQQGIQQERAHRYQQQLADWQKSPSVPLLQRGKTASAAATPPTASLPPLKKGGGGDLKPKAPKPLPPLTKEELAELPELPEGWGWCKLGNVGLVGTGITPLKGRSDFYANGNIPWVTSGALNDNFVTEASDYITELALKETNLRIYPKHTLLIALYGEGKTRGKCSELLIEATTNQAIAAIVQEGISEKLRKFIKWFFQKNYGDIRLKSSGGVQPNLNLSIIENTLFPMCSIEEANQIVDAIETKLSEVDQLELTLTTSLQQAEALRQSILKRAFSGQLVLQDPHDEPATVLLARIKAERATVSAKPCRRKDMSARRFG
jgi:type I restriction enzyme, S subunit